MTCRHPSSNIKLIQAFSSVFWCGTNRIAGATECGCDGAQGTSGFAIVSAQNVNLAFAPGLTIWWRHLVKSLAFPEDDAGVCIRRPRSRRRHKGVRRVFSLRDDAFKTACAALSQQCLGILAGLRVAYMRMIMPTQQRCEPLPAGGEWKAT